MLQFTPSSLTEIMKFITPLFVIKKDYIYTSIYLNSMREGMFYLMNKFTIEHEGLVQVKVGSGDGINNNNNHIVKRDTSGNDNNNA